MKQRFIEELGTRRRKVIKVKHFEPGPFCLDYILMPFGYAYNTELCAAKKGDTLRLFDGGEYRIFAIRRLPLSSSLADALCRIRYGIPLKGAVSRWKENAKLEGHSGKVVSTEECLWIIYETAESDTEKAGTV